MPDFSMHKLGKLAPKLDDKRLKLAKYMKEELIAPPASVDWAAAITDWGMLANDSLGDCTIAAVAHGLQSAMNQVGWPWDTSVDVGEVIKYYSWWCGYNPSDPSTDQGGVEVDVLNSWRKMGYAGHSLIAYADPDVNDLVHIKQSIALFGGVYIGLALPLSAQSQDIWDVHGNPNDPNSAAAPGSWGGHAVYCLGYDADYVYCITWGQVLRMTWKFFLTYVDEAHTLFLGMWMEKKTAPSGFDYAQLLADLAEVVG